MYGGAAPHTSAPAEAVSPQGDRRQSIGLVPPRGTEPLSSVQVVVGLSGGVDSAVAAHMLLRQGLSVAGLLLEIPHAHTPYEQARRVADHLNIPLLVRPAGEAFTRQVIGDFCLQYAQGRTPNPCVVCNPAVKFQALLQTADELGAPWVATGHYAGIDRAQDGRMRLLRDESCDKDQSYLLYRLEQRQLQRIRFPLYGFDKRWVRGMARELCLPSADTKDSQDICFVPEGDHVAFLRAAGVKAAAGTFVSPDGRVLGRHDGTFAFTVGQRKGLGVSAAERLYVLAIRPETGEVVLGGRELLRRSRLLLEQVCYIPFAQPVGPLRVTAKVRHGGRETPATLLPLPGGAAELLFDTPVEAPAPGQSAVFYCGTLVLGGGVIAQSGD